MLACSARASLHVLACVLTCPCGQVFSQPVHMVVQITAAVFGNDENTTKVAAGILATLMKRGYDKAQLEHVKK